MRERVTVRSSGWLQIHVGANLLRCKFAVKLLMGHLNLQNGVTCLDLRRDYFVTIVIGLDRDWRQKAVFSPLTKVYSVFTEKNKSVLIEFAINIPRLCIGTVTNTTAMLL